MYPLQPILSFIVFVGQTTDRKVERSRIEGRRVDQKYETITSLRLKVAGPAEQKGKMKAKFPNCDWKRMQIIRI